MSNKGVKVALKDLYYAILTVDTASDNVAQYDTPVLITGLIKANINPNSNIDTLFADDGPYDTASQLGKIALELNVADLSLEQRIALLGKSALTAGVMFDGSEDSPPWLAIGFKSKKSNGKYRYVWLLKGKFSEPEDNSETQGDTVNFQTPTITGNFVTRECDGNWRKRTDEDVTGYVAATGTNWFTDGPDTP